MGPVCKFLPHRKRDEMLYLVWAVALCWRSAERVAPRRTIVNATKLTLSDHQIALAGVMATAAATKMTQAQSADLHQQLKDAIHGTTPAVLGAGQ